MKKLCMLLVLLAVAGCANHPSGDTIKTRTALVDASVSALAANLAISGVKIPQADLDQLNKLALDVQANADQIAQDLDPAPRLKQIEATIVLIGNLLEPYKGQAPGVAAAIVADINVVEAMLAQLGVKGAA